ncbi:MAG: SET domain-containing protein [bacterium]|nr:SET domain-containing protein [bacterium]
MENKTTEFSFILKPSEHGLGVFAAHDIKKNTHLRLFGDNETLNLRSLLRKKDEVPKLFRNYCMDRGDKLICPKDFGQMHVGWYLNHSKKSNAYPDKDYKWYAAKHIKEGEEITINYNLLCEPEDNKPNYY